MRKGTTIILLAIVLAFGAYIKFYESKRPNTEEAERRAGNIVNFDRTKINGIVILNGDDRIELKRDGQTWRLTAPIEDLADNALVDGVLSDLESWPKENTIDAKEIAQDKSKLEEFGLAKPKLRLRLSGEEAPPEIQFGSAGALENRLYVKLANRKDVYLAPQNIRDEISKKAADFRDRKLTSTMATQVIRVALKTGLGEMELEKRGEHWEITRPLRARADDQKINDLIAQVVNSRIAQFVANDKGDLHSYGLAEPRGSITIFTADDKQGQLLQLGAAPAAQKDEVYARFAPRGGVYLLANKIEQILSLKPNDLRDRHLVRFDENQLDRITIDAPGKMKTVLARKGEDWTIDGKAPANNAEVRRFLDTMRDAQVTRFVADVASELPKYGLDHPSLVVTLSSFASENTAESKAGEEPLATVAFGKIEREEIYARVDDEPFVVAINRKFVDEIAADPLTWQENAIFKFKPAQVHRLAATIERELVFTRDAAKKWTSSAGPVNQVNVESLLNTLTSLRAVRWLGRDAAPGAFEQPQATIVFTTSPDDKQTHKLVISRTAGDGMWNARVEGRDGFFLISNPDYNAFRLPLLQMAPAPSPAPPTPSPTAKP
ncbi:MAG: DUF4340 domain-containing protein [Verrucomicrobiota bacterium]|nr:DUF4340 domain-containing protein [Verrucomicrobiota bacterium]